jgi:hypothetical protein
VTHRPLAQPVLPVTICITGKLQSWGPKIALTKVVSSSLLLHFLLTVSTSSLSTMPSFVLCTDYYEFLDPFKPPKVPAGTFLGSWLRFLQTFLTKY